MSKSTAGFHLATFSAMLAAACLISLSKQEVSEEEAMYFHDTAYRQAYLRLLTLVSAFYQRHNGADAYFVEAQKLSQVDYDSSKIIQAFIGIISGEEDLEDIQQRGIDQDRLFQRLEGPVDTMRTAEANSDIELTEHERERTNERLREFTSIYTFAPKNAIRGLYLDTEPLGLTREPTPVALAH